MDSILKDERFAKIATDRKFRGAGRKQRKVAIDHRFKSMFKDERFVSKCTVDKRGRPQTFTSKENYRKYYDIQSESDDSTDSGEDDEQQYIVNNGKEAVSESDRDGSEEATADEKAEQSDAESSSSDEEDDVTVDDQIDYVTPGDQIDLEVKKKLCNSEVDYARGEAALFSDSSSGDDSDTDTEAETQQEGATTSGFSKWGELDGDAERTEDASRRLALCNMDWDRVTAEDVFLALSSFCPPGGSVKKVDIYLSDFGRERLADEERLGPQELRKNSEQGTEQQTISDDEDYSDLSKTRQKEARAEKAAMERVRQYQINRLKYYYAIIEMDSLNTSNSVYEECDGMEYELSATRFDLRFVPDSMEFSDAPSSSCHSLPNPDQYKPKSFFTTALQQGKVELTWDEADITREQKLRKAYDLMDGEDETGADYSSVLACSSGSSDEDEAQTGNSSRKMRPQTKTNTSDNDEEADAVGSGSDSDNEEESINKYRALLIGNNTDQQPDDPTGQEELGDMEVTWTPDDQQTNDDEQPSADESELTPWEKYLKKKRDKRKLKKSRRQGDESDSHGPEESQLLRKEEEEEDKIGQPLPQGKRKKKPKKVKQERQNNDENKSTELDLLVMDSDDDKRHFNYKTIVEQEKVEAAPAKSKKKWKKRRKDMKAAVDDGVGENDFNVDVTDNRFAAIFSRPEFNIDPSEPNFKKTKAMDRLIGEKQKRIQLVEDRKVASTTRDANAGTTAKKSRLDPEVSAALKSVKSKWGKNAKKKKKT